MQQIPQVATQLTTQGEIESQIDDILCNQLGNANVVY